MRFTSTLAAGAFAAVANAQNYLGFNSGATLADRSAKFKADFKAEFETAAKLHNAPGDFNSVRLYTNIQAYSEDAPIEAFDAAVETKTNILLGCWASGTDNIDKEIRALKKAIEIHGKALTDLIIGVTIGSEDLYRISETGVKNEAGVGNSPKAIVGFIDDWRKAFSSGPLSQVPVGHADTWDVWANQTNKPVIDACDFIAVHEYPYYENDKGNHIDNAGALFDRAFQVALDAAGDKPVWLTETGWPYIGPDWDEAVASVKNAKTYWDEVGCRKLFGKTPTFWYTLRDSNPDNKMKFAITKNLSTKPLFDLSCPDTFETDERTSSATRSSTASPSATRSSSIRSSSTASVPSSSTTPADGDDVDDEDEDEVEDDVDDEVEDDVDDEVEDVVDDEVEDDADGVVGEEGTETEAAAIPTRTPEGTNNGDGEAAASGLKMLPVASYVVLALAGAALSLF